MNAPVMTDDDGLFNTLSIEDFNHVFTDKRVTIRGRIGGFIRPSISQHIGNYETVASGFEISHLVAPVVGRGRKPVEEKESGVSRRIRRGDIIVVFESSGCNKIFVESGLHDCLQKRPAHRDRGASYTITEPGARM